MGYSQLSLSDLRGRLGDRFEGKAFWTDAEADLAINEALLTWGLLTGRWKRRVVLETAADTILYALPATMLYRMRVEFNGRPLSPSSREDLAYGRKNWRTETTASGGDVPTRPTVWAPVSLQLIYLWPADHAGHNSLTIDGVSQTPVLVADEDAVDLGEEDVTVLLGYALHVASLKKGGPWFAATAPLFTAFLRAAGEENSLITTSQAYRRFLGLDHRDLKPFREAVSSVSKLAEAGA